MRKLSSLVVLPAVIVAGLIVLGGRAESAQAADCVAPANPVVCENSLPGSPPEEWESAGSSSIQGFATDFSVDQGETVHFKVDTDASDYRIDIYRLGWYGGDGARHHGTVEPSAALPQMQPACLYEDSTGLTDCGNWSESASWAVPETAPSGIYIARLEREDEASGSNHIVFVVRDDDGNSDVLFQPSDSTWHAYNSLRRQEPLRLPAAGGAGLQGQLQPPVPNSRETMNINFLFSAEYPMIRWLERNGFDVSYFTRPGQRPPRRGAPRARARSLGRTRRVLVGRTAAGVRGRARRRRQPRVLQRERSLLEDALGAIHRRLGHAPQDACHLQGDARGREDRPESRLDGHLARPALQPACRRRSPGERAHRPDLHRQRVRATTRSASRPSTGSCACGGTRRRRSFRPAVPSPSRRARSATSGTRISTTAIGRTGSPTSPRPRVNVNSRITDHGSNYAPGVATHRLTLYKHPSGALVFGAGTVQWSWGLDDEHDHWPGGSPPPPSRDMQQATVNLFADMGVQPATRQADLVAASASTDDEAPSALVVSPAPFGRVQSGSAVTISGTATDTGGGQVANVEVSTDGGSTWHPATGRGNWTYRWTPGPVGQALRSAPERSTTAPTWGRRSPAHGRTSSRAPAHAASGTTRSCPRRRAWTRRSRSSWGSSSCPRRTASSPPSASTRAPATPARTSAASGSADGTKLAEATFTNETATGWQEVAFPGAVAVNAGETYVVSYHAPNGQFAVERDFFAAEFVHAPLRAPSSASSGGNGVFRYGPGGFPSDTYVEVELLRRPRLHLGRVT